MKYINYLLLVICVGLIIFTSLFLQSNKGATASPEKSEKPEHPEKSQKLEVYSMNASITIPDYAEFCGKKIALTRYDMHERFDREINAFTYLHSTTMLYIKRANRYFPIIEPILKKNGIPDDFKYLATIESNLDIRAVSPAKAVGLWQLMPNAGKMYGLEITDQVDERYHIEKATEAACKYFKEAYGKYNDWSTVAASYNAGMGRISSQLDSQSVDSAYDLLLVEETSRYLFRIMAIREIFSNPYKYGFILKPENLYLPIETKKVEVAQDVPNLAAFAQEHQLTYAQLKDFNSWLRDRKLKVAPGKKYLIDIPDKEDLFYDKKNIKVHNKAWIRE